MLQEIAYGGIHICHGRLLYSLAAVAQLKQRSFYKRRYAIYVYIHSRKKKPLQCHGFQYKSMTNISTYYKLEYVEYVSSAFPIENIAGYV